MSEFSAKESEMVLAALIGLSVANSVEEHARQADPDSAYGGFYDALKAVTKKVYSEEAFDKAMEATAGEVDPVYFEEICQNWQKENEG